ncbi:tripartite tricarboxylate transporter permease [Caproiciproducens faecalis]|uniref:Tripartite tricarboxylate transporter permease n=1 Tax=Caproiciproducens faecalis TaxID=2820301 RepID=A0ABS7DJZ7_9FIRM|nr:tripartite tricarboxylate transporter permease [Caproiciproducens faecalis]MBW7571412.1 tripartite tricarboxylate transporter permease [Caproiciproducens faecalis]
MQLISGFISIFHPLTLALIVGGVIAGIIFGAIPGISAFTALAIMMPLTFAMDPINGISFLIAVYVGGVSGGLISAILLGIPGTPSSIATCFDGYPMAQKGEAKKAMGIGVLYSFLGGTFSAIVLVFLGPLIAMVALQFSPYEYFAVILFALTTVSSLAEGDLVRGLLSCLLGVSLAFVGMDKLSAYTRFTMGINDLGNGFSLVPLLIGVFAVSQIMGAAKNRCKEKEKQENVQEKVEQRKVKGFGISMREFIDEGYNAISSALIGLVIGILPGIGGNVSNLVSYAYVKKHSKHPEKFGTGIMSGIVASETSNNAAVGGALIILLTLGIPGDNATSMILAGFQLHGLAPGPLLFSTGSALIYGIFAAFILANVVMLITEFYGLPIFAKVLSIRTEILMPMVIAACFVGSFSSNSRIFDILVMVIFGFIGYIMKKFKLPLAPMVVGFILAPLLEENLRRSLMRTGGSIMPILASPLADVFLILTVVMVVLAIRGEIKDSKKKDTAEATA